MFEKALNKKILVLAGTAIAILSFISFHKAQMQKALNSEQAQQAEAGLNDIKAAGCEFTLKVKNIVRDDCQDWAKQNNINF